MNPKTYQERDMNTPQKPTLVGDLKITGYDRLWNWFGLSRASWLVIPRSMMHSMPDEWQDKMAALLEEWDETWDTEDMPSTIVQARSGNKYTKFPKWLLNYKYIDKERINTLRRNRSEK